MQPNTPETLGNPFEGFSVPRGQQQQIFSAYEAWARSQSSKAAGMFVMAVHKGEGQLERREGFLPVCVPDLREEGDKTTASAFRNWIEARRETLEEIAARIAPDCYLDLDFSSPGPGGRGRSTLVNWVVRRSEARESEERTADDSRIPYRTVPARPALLLSWMFDREGVGRRFTTIWMAVLVMGAGLISAALTMLLATILLQAVVLSGAIVAVVLILAAASLWLANAMRPIWLLPEQKLVIAPSWMLGFREAFGQLHMGQRLQPNTLRPIALVRYQAECPVCGSDIELLPGGAQFPGRVVGRCLDAPAEHVVSFDPVTRKGVQLEPRDRGGPPGISRSD